MHEVKSEPYSYHTFIFPFTWRGQDFKTFVRYFDDNNCWNNFDMLDEQNICSNSMITKRDELLSLYKEYQYFHPYARKAIYGFEEGIVRNYSFMYEKVHNKAHYYIEKNNKKYDLHVNSIKLKIYNTGVALFILEAENYGVSEKGVLQNTFDDVKNINEYGRRISMPVLKDINLCADSLELKIGNISFKDNFMAYIEKVKKMDNITSDDIKLTDISNVIREVLCYRGDYNISPIPILDDRMYVMCIAKDSKAIIECTDEGSKSAYEFVHIDPAGECTCHDKGMRKELLDKALYKRWCDWNSYYYITNYSFMYLTEDDVPPHLVESFLTQYYQMGCLTIAQRASIMNFKREVTSIAAGLEKKGKTLSMPSVNSIMDLQERFVAFESQLFFDEVSSEQQAIEIYDMLKQALLIEKEKDSLKSQLESMYTISDTTNGFGINKIMLIFTWISGVMSFASIIMTMMQIEGFKNIQCLKWLNLTGPADSDGAGVGIIVAMSLLLVILVSVLVTVYILIRYRRKKG